MNVSCPECNTTHAVCPYQANAAGVPISYICLARVHAGHGFWFARTA